MSKVLVSDVAMINKENFNINEVDYINYLDTSSITNNKILGFQKLDIENDKIPSRAKRKVTNNTIVYSSVRPRLCHFGILKDIPKNTVVSTGFITIDAKEEKIDPYYLYYLLTTNDKIEYISNIADTAVSSYPSINSSDIENMELNIIDDLKKQKEIVSILKSIDEKIENNNQINTELEAMAKTIYDYWFLQFEFPNEDGKPYKSSGGKMVWNEELKRKIPEGWKCGTIGDLFFSQSGYAFKSSNWTKKGHPVLTIKCINEDGTINISESSFIKEYTNSLSKYSVKNGNMIFAMSGNTIGKLGIIASNIDNILINQRVLIIKTQTSDMAYPYFTIKNNKIQNSIFQLGANSAQPNISEDLLKSIKICLPNKKSLDNYNNKCKAIFDTIIVNRIENQELSSLRDFLLPLLMNGQVEFKEVGFVEE